MEQAITRYPNHTFLKSNDPADISGVWDVGIALETLEHLPRPEVLEAYIEAMARSVKTFIVTVPVEIGPVFASKFLYKMVVHRSVQKHSLLEFALQSAGLSRYVEQNEHKGFDYRTLLRLMSRHFNDIKVSGINARLPIILNTQVGIVATSRYLP